MAFYVGQKVVCVDGVAHHKYITGLYPKVRGDLDGLTEGSVYTVRAVGRWHPKGGPSVWLQEITRPIKTSAAMSFGEPGYAVQRFRAVVERKTDISVFKAMLNSSDEQVVA